MTSFVPACTDIPAGSFLMGGIPDDKFVSTVELPRHEVTVRPFRMGIFPISFGEWFGVTGGHAPQADPSLPVTGVTFPEIENFLDLLSQQTSLIFRLPSEAEWEYACRSGSATVFPSGSQLHSEQANFLYDESGQAVGHGTPLPPGRYPANAFGLHDMLGNVCEWTADAWHPDFHNAPADGSPWLDAGKPGHRVIRGGAWDHLPRVLRASWRDWAPEDARWDNLGFRVAQPI